MVLPQPFHPLPTSSRLEKKKKKMNPLFSQLEHRLRRAWDADGFGVPRGMSGVFIPEHSLTSLSPIKNIPPCPGGCFVQLLLGIPDKKNIPSNHPGQAQTPHLISVLFPFHPFSPKDAGGQDVAVPTPNLITSGISGVFFPPPR